MTAHVRMLHEKLGAIIDPAARLEVLHQDHAAFFEGPTWREDHLLLSNIAGNSILRWRQNGGVEEAITDIYPSDEPSEPHEFDLGFRKVLLRGANGTALDQYGRLVFCGYGIRQVVRVEDDGSRTVLARRFGEARLNRPNDLVYRSDGLLYFTDSAADLASDPGDPQRGLPHTGVYMIRDRELHKLVDQFQVPNGLAFSPDEQHLYVNDTRRKVIERFDVHADGSIGTPRLIVDMNHDDAPGVPDGMKVDGAGNIFCTGPGGLWIMDADGLHLGTILTPERLTNVAFGGEDGKWLFLTGPSYLYRIAIR